MNLVYARFTDGFDVLVSLPENRRLMREALVVRYFPGQAKALLGPVVPQEPEDSRMEEEPPEFRRDPAFRRKIIDVYDHQCAACGLRIRLPQAQDVSFIDAAHLTPLLRKPQRPPHERSGTLQEPPRGHGQSPHRARPGPHLASLPYPASPSVHRRERPAGTGKPEGPTTPGGRLPARRGRPGLAGGTANSVNSSHSFLAERNGSIGQQDG